MSDQHAHLSLRRIRRRSSQAQRQRRSFKPQVHYDDRPAHADQLAAMAIRVREKFDVQVAEHVEGQPKPKMMLRFELNRRSPPEEEFGRAGLQLLDSSEPERTIVYSPDPDLPLLRDRLAEYAEGEREPEQPPAEGEESKLRAAKHEAFFDSIDQFGSITPRERVTARLQDAIDGLADGESLVVDVELYYAPDRALREEWLQEIRSLVSTHGEELDDYVGEVAGVVLLRARAGAELIGRLAALDQVAVIDAVPEPYVDHAEIAELQDVDVLPNPAPEPDESAPVVGMIDTGLNFGHPLFAECVHEDDVVALHPAFGDQAEDGHGHGTRMAGRIIFGDVLVAARSGQWEAACELASVRVLDAEGCPPENANYTKLIADAVDELVREMDVRIINLSISETATPYLGGHSAPLAAVLDTLAARHHLLIVTCVGNLRYGDLAPQAQLFTAWPEYLGDEAGRQLLNPGQAALSLTAGAVSANDAVEAQLPTTAVATAGGPAPFTRRGPGLGGAIKPELVADGGNWAYDRDTGDQQSEPALGVLSTSAAIQQRIFEFGEGTSFAAASLTNAAARVAGRYPNFQATTYRALLLGAAHHRGPREQLFDTLSDGKRRAALTQLCGYGEVDLNRCEFSTDSRVVLVGEDELLPDHFHVYRLPLTDAWRFVPGRRTLTVSLAFESPVRHRRLDYLGTKMEFIVVRGLEEEETFDAASAKVKDVESTVLSKAAVDLKPTRTARSAGANQMATLTWTSRPRGMDDEDDWFLVVRSVNRWLRNAHGAQPYSVAVTMEVERSEQLFAELELELRAQAELEGEARV
jgi:Subtilase family